MSPPVRLHVPEDPEHVCYQHICDRCPRCEGGVCCGLEVGEAGLPLQGTWPGKTHGKLGVLYKRPADGKVRCHGCGRYFEDLGPHLRVRHNLRADSYRAMFGLNTRTPLVTDQLRDMKRSLGMQYGHRLTVEERKIFTPEQRSRWARDREARAETRVNRGLQPRVGGKWVPATEGTIIARRAPKLGVI